MVNNNIFFKKHSIILYKCVFVILIFGFAFIADAAVLSVSPGTGVYTAGQTFTARIVVNTVGKSVNAADGSISFNPKELSVLSISKGSIFNLWTAEPAFSNTNGTITFSGGTPTGYKGSAGTVISITFKAKNAGNPKVRFTSGSVLAADGLGTNILTNMSGGSFTIASTEVVPEPETIKYIAPANTPEAPKIKSSTHPNPDGWYKENTATLSWSLPEDVIAVRTLLDENSGSIPTKIYNTPINSITLEELDEGIQYFHIQFKNDNGWGRVSHYRLAVDLENPTKFSINLEDDADLSSPEQTLVFSIEDVTSDVRRFSVQVDGGEPYEYIDDTGSSSIKLTGLVPGMHSVIIEAYDQAGNSILSTFSFSILAFDKPQFTEYPSEISQKVIPVIKGVTRSNSEVHVSIKKIGSDTQTITLQSSESGEFVYIPESKFSLGVYELSAVAIDQYGAQSDVSDTIRIAVQEPGYIRIGAIAVSVLSIIVPLIAIATLLVLGIWLLIVRLRALRRGVTKETEEALNILDTEFDSLQKELKIQKEILIKSRKTKKLTKAEAQVLQTVSEALATSRKRVKKEITDVEDIVE